MSEELKIGVVVLAAGRSQRMGGANKLLMQVEGQAMIVRTLEMVLDAQIGDVFVVTGHQVEKVREVLAGYRVRFVHNAEYADGLSTSVRAGVAGLDGNYAGALVMLGDMPDVPANVLRALAARFSAPADICVPMFKGRRGNPVIWGADYFSEIAKLAGDRGAQGLLKTHADKVIEVEVASEAIFIDYDTPDRFTEIDNESK